MEEEEEHQTYLVAVSLEAITMHLRHPRPLAVVCSVAMLRQVRPPQAVYLEVERRLLQPK